MFGNTISNHKTWKLCIIYEMHFSLFTALILHACSMELFPCCILLIAQDAMYHLRYLVSLYNRARETKAASDSNPEALNHGIAFAELVSYIEDALTDTEVAPIFKLADLVSL